MRRRDRQRGRERRQLRRHRALHTGCGRTVVWRSRQQAQVVSGTRELARDRLGDRLTRKLVVVAIVNGSRNSEHPGDQDGQLAHQLTIPGEKPAVGSASGVEQQAFFRTSQRRQGLALAGAQGAGIREQCGEFCRAFRSPQRIGQGVKGGCDCLGQRFDGAACRTDQNRRHNERIDEEADPDADEGLDHPLDGIVRAASTADREHQHRADGNLIRRAGGQPQRPRQ